MTGGDYRNRLRPARDVAEETNGRAYIDTQTGDYYIQLMKWNPSDPEWRFCGTTPEDAVREYKEYCRELSEWNGPK